jgi:hypothetical protein
MVIYSLCLTGLKSLIKADTETLARGATMLQDWSEKLGYEIALGVVGLLLSVTVLCVVSCIAAYKGRDRRWVFSVTSAIIQRIMPKNTVVSVMLLMDVSTVTVINVISRITRAKLIINLFVIIIL